MLCGSAFKNKGVQAMLDAVIDYLPAPDRHPAGEGACSRTASSASARPATMSRSPALAFKIMTDPYVGQLIFFRVYSGVVNSGDSVYNPIKGKKERLGRILQMHANQREEIKEVRAGDIAAAVGLKEATTGDTLCDPNKIIILEKMEFPEPVISQAVEPKTKADQEKDGRARSGAWRRRIRRSVCAPTRSPARPSSPAWASCISRSSSTACGASSASRPTSGKPQVAYREAIKKTVESRGQVHQAVRRQGPVRACAG